MARAKCIFCGKEQEDHKGIYLAKNDGNMLYFSSSKCAKNFLKLGRDKRRVRWTEAFHLTREKRYAKEKERERMEREREGKVIKEMGEKDVKKSEGVVGNKAVRNVKKG